MKTRSLRTSIITLVVGACLSAATASAQINPEGGDVWVPPPDDNGSAQQTQQQQQPWYQGGPTGQQPVEQPPRVQQGPTQSSQPSQAQQPAGPDDHTRVIGRLAVGYMGATQVPIGSLTGGGFGVDTMTAPALGIRYWLAELVGLDIGLGLSFLGGNVQSGADSFPADSAFAMLIHGGVPLAIYHQEHYKFLIIPEVNLGFSTGTAYGPSQDFDRGRNGFIFQLGGRLGTEIHFGFMDIPQLSLQASVGLYFSYASVGVGGDRARTADAVGQNSYSLATTVMGQPWDIFLGSITALYYF